MEQFEKIGKVTLDLTNYKGTDVYSDGDIEEEILNIARDNDPSSFDEIIEKRLSWPILYHLSAKRENIVEWLDIDKSHKVLEVGSGCGAITGVISRKAKEVTCVDLSKRRSMINAYRHKDCDNITVSVGNFTDVEPTLPCDYDYILLIGVFEYGRCYIPGDKPFHDFLSIIKKHLKADGKVVIAIENRLGLKYFAGFTEDHVGSFFTGIENYDSSSDVRTFSKNALERMFKEAGFDECSFFYPYPDYKFPFDIFSDNRLPKPGELVLNDLNLDRDRISLFDEKKAVDSLAEDGLFPVFANSFMAVLGRRPEADYVRYSFNRCEAFSIRTVIKGGKVIKSPVSEAGKAHIRNLGTSFEKLSERYAGSEVTIAPVIVSEGGAYAFFDMMPGVTLESEFDRLLASGDKEGFADLYRLYVSRLGYNKDYPYSDTDLVFSNVLDDNGKWSLIDYEWGAPVATDPGYMGLRALYLYMLERDFKCFEGLDFLKELTGASDADIEAFLDKEKAFQECVTGGRLSLTHMKALMGRSKIDFKEFAGTVLKGRVDAGNFKETMEKGKEKILPQLYFDRGAGYSEADSLFVNAAVVSDTRIVFDAAFTEDVINLRVDPMMEPGFIYIDRLLINGTQFPLSGKKNVEANGRRLRGDAPGFFFDTPDPNICLHLGGIRKQKVNELHAEFRYIVVSPELTGNISGNIKRIF